MTTGHRSATGRSRRAERTALLCGWLALAPTMAACGAERAALVDVTVDVDGHALCVWAYGDGERLFVERYAREPGASRPPSGSLTFVAGARTRDEVHVGARVLRGGAIVGEGRRSVRFSDGLVHVPLPVGRCAPHAPAESASWVVGTLPSGARRALLADLDGDGRDELAAWDEDGTLHVLDGDGARVSSPSELGALTLVSVGDADGDCAADLVAVGESEVRIVRSAARSPVLGPSLASGARDAAFGSFSGEGALALATALGVVVVPLRSGAARRVDGAFDALGADDLDGDGFDDVVASGPGGTRYLLGGPSGLEDVPAGLPPRIAASVGPVVLADLDGDGRADLVAADGALLRVALNRGDGLLEERGAQAPLSLEAPIAIVRAGDLDGDCRAELVAIGADGSVAVIAMRGSVPSRLEGAWPMALDAAVGDVDGDGLRELVLVGADGEVRAWRP